MSPDRQIFRRYRKFSLPIPIRIGDNSIVHAVGEGSIVSTSIQLEKVYLVPSLGANLFSIAQAADKGLVANFGPASLTLSLNNRCIAKGARSGGDYLLNLEIVPALETALAATTLENWHKRLNHLPRELVVAIARDNVVDGLRMKSDEEECIDCKLNKCRRASHPSRTSPKATKAGQSLHFDIIGKISPPGHNGQNHILVCRDEFSRFRMICCVKSKGSSPSDDQQSRT